MQTGVSGAVQPAHNSELKRWLERLRDFATGANVVGVLGALLALWCLLALPSDNYGNIRIPVYATIAGWTLLYPRVALYLLPVAVPWGSLDPITIGGLTLNGADLLILFLAASWGLSVALRRYKDQNITRGGPLDYDGFPIPRYLAFTTLALLLAMLISMTNTFSLSSSIKEISKWLEVAIVLLLGSLYIRTRQQIWTLVVIICLAAISQALYGYTQAFLNLGPLDFVRNDGLRIYGTFGQPNPYAGYINMTLPIAIALTLLSSSAKLRILGGITTAILGWAEYLSQSRGGQIAIAVAMFYIVAAGMPKLQPLIRIGILGALGVFAAYCAGLVPVKLLAPILKILGLVSISFTTPSSDDFSTAERLAHWIAGLRMFLEHPFTGVGIGNYPDLYPNYFITIFVNPLGHAHNYYINIAAETGLLGLVAFILFLIAIFIAGNKTLHTINKRYQEIKTVRAQSTAAPTTAQIRTRATLLTQIGNDRALAIGLIATLVAVCAHNMVDNLFVHSMTSLFALLIIILIRLEKVSPTNSI